MQVVPATEDDEDGVPVHMEYTAGEMQSAGVEGVYLLRGALTGAECASILKSIKLMVDDGVQAEPIRYIATVPGPICCPTCTWSMPPPHHHHHSVSGTARVRIWTTSARACPSTPHRCLGWLQ